jgi:hypothetical protein
MYFPQMITRNEKKSQSRMFVAVALFIASISTSFVIAFISSQGSTYWVMREPVPVGVKITGENVALVKVKLARSTPGYLESTFSPIGSFTKRSLSQGEILHRDALTNSSNQETSGSVSLAIRSTDIPLMTKVGDLVAIYQLHDARNGESAIEPRLVISQVFVEEISGRESNFSGEFSITVSLDRKDISTLLASTTSGRLVIAAVSG